MWHWRINGLSKFVGNEKMFSENSFLKKNTLLSHYIFIYIVPQGYLDYLHNHILLSRDETFIFPFIIGLSIFLSSLYSFHHFIT